MPASYLPYEPDQDFLLPPSLSEWLPEGHLAYFISDSVDSLDLSAFHARRHKAMSYGHMLKAEAELQAQIAALFKRAQAADEEQGAKAQLDVPAEIARRQDRLKAIQAARARLEQRQREAELARGRHPDDPPRGGRWKRSFGVPEDKAQENFTDPDSRIMKRAGGGFDASYNA